MQPYLLKIFNSFDSQTPDFLQGLSSMLLTIVNRSEALQVPIPVQLWKPQKPEEDLAFQETCLLVDGSTGRVAMRLYQWVSGEVLHGRTISCPIQSQVGAAIGKIYKALRGFDSACFHRPHLWDLAQFPRSYTSLLQYIEDDQLRATIADVYAHYQAHIIPFAEEFPSSIIMADCNDANVIVRPAPPSGADLVTGLIDFSDAVFTWSVNEVAIAMAYCVLNPSGLVDPLLSMGSLLLGYLVARGSESGGLTQREERSLLPLMCVRLSISIMVGSYSIREEPQNEYLNIHARPARQALRTLWQLDRDKATRFFHGVGVRAVSLRESFSGSSGDFEGVEETVSALLAEYFPGRE